MTIRLNKKVMVIKIEYYQFGNTFIKHLRDFLNDLQQSDTWKSQLTININFISSKNGNDEKHVMHSKSGNIEVLISDEADEVMKKLFIL